MAPDGQHIALTMSESGPSGIFTMKASDGSDRINITNNPSTDLTADWK